MLIQLIETASLSLPGTLGQFESMYRRIPQYLDFGRSPVARFCASWTPCVVVFDGRASILTPSEQTCRSARKEPRDIELIYYSFCF